MRVVHVVILLMIIPYTSTSIGYISDTYSGFPSLYDSQEVERVYAHDLSSEIFHSIFISQYKEFIIKLTENGSREVGSEANFYSMQWLTNKLVEISNGRIEVEVMGKYMSVVGRLPGYLPDSAPCIMVGGHYDSVAGAPGANDDGTGVATVLELARVMSGYKWPLDIYFCAWNAEEVGLLGSQEAVRIFANRGLNILLYYNIDMLLVEDPTAPPDERILMAYNEAEYWALLTRAMSNNYGYNLIHPIHSTQFSAWTRSDHASFLQAGYEQVLFAFESGFSSDNAYHQPTDTYDNELYNYTVAIETVKAIGASMAFTMAREYGQPTKVKIHGAVTEGNRQKYFFPLTTETDFLVSGIWSGGGLNFSLYAPSGILVEFEQLDHVSLSPETILNTTVNEVGIYTLLIDSSGGSSDDNDNDDITRHYLAYEKAKFSGYELEVKYDTDINKDGVLDKHQFWFDATLFEVDTDGDNLSNGMELILGTSPEEEDTDFDGLPDDWEVENRTNPCVADAENDIDNDDLPNVDEYAHGTLPFHNDTDNDTLLDGYEVTYGLNPLENDTSSDLDSDGLNNLLEFSIGTIPNDNDTDDDTIPDGWEHFNLLDPLIDDTDLDPDGDSFSNLDEYSLGLDPQSPDLRFDYILLIGIPVTIIVVFLVFIFLKRRHA